MIVFQASIFFLHIFKLLSSSSSSLLDEKEKMTDVIFYTCGFIFFFDQKKKHCEQLRVFIALQGFWFLYFVNHTIHIHTHTHSLTHAHTPQKREHKNKRSQGKKKTKTSRGVSKNSSYNQKEIVKCLCSSSLRWTKAQYLQVYAHCIAMAKCC